MSKFTFTVLDLYKLPKTSHVWKQLYSLTVKGWHARDEFESIRNKFYSTGKFIILIVYDKSTPIAWGMRVSYNNKVYPNLWLYTKPSHRKLGIQKNIVLPYWNKKNEKFVVWNDCKRQEETFKYITNKKEVK